MKKIVQLTILAFTTFIATAQKIEITGPIGSGKFGKRVFALPNGNYAITDPNYDEGGLTDIGAVYLYNGSNHTVISTLKGSTNGDQIGSERITILPSGNFLVASQYWDNGTAINVGAVTWVNGISGLNGNVSATNSLVGSTSNDRVGYYFGNNIMVLANGNYIVRSYEWDNGTAVDAGAVTWGNGTTGTTGVVSASNSLVGSNTNDKIGYWALVELTNGNYVVANPEWDNGTAVDAGAVTWGNGTTGITGVVSAINSLVGTQNNDNVGNLSGNHRVMTLTNGNYVVCSPLWDNGAITNAGAATWCNGTTGRVGNVDVSNSLVGANNNDRVSYSDCRALSNGNYVVCSNSWRNGSFFNAGAATWGNGTTGTFGPVSTINSIVGNKSNDFVGQSIVPLTNGNYVVSSPGWGNGLSNGVGAATWGNGVSGTALVVDASNSIVGSTNGDNVSSPYILPLTNGNYVIQSFNWNNGSIARAGAVTWGNGSTGTFGVVSAINSLVGSNVDDQVGYYSTTILTNGNYVVGSPYWNNGSTVDVGAATWGNGTVGITGTISNSNSLVGNQANDLISRSGITKLNNGNYLVQSMNWDNGSIVDAGAVTWGDGTTGVIGTVSNTNSIVGSTTNDNLGNGGAVPLSNGAAVLHNRNWDHNGQVDAGAATWINGLNAVVGEISAANSLVGNFGGDEVGSGSSSLNSNEYQTLNFGYGAGSASLGAITFAKKDIGITGYINGCNSVISNVSNGIVDWVNNTAYNPVFNYYIAGLPEENKVVVLKPYAPSLANHLETVILNISGTNNYDFINNNCRIIASTQPTGASSTAIKALTTAKVWIDATQAPQYVKRHFEITPNINASTATAKVTLYFTDADFIDFNSQTPAPFAPLPLSTDPPALMTIRKQNLLIEKRPGTTNNPSTGAPNTYTGTPETINPNDVDINWNATLNRWEVAFEVTGFSGFFVKTIPWILPIEWLNVNAKLNLQKQPIISWLVQENNIENYTVQKSIDGINFETIAVVNSKSDGKNQYQHVYQNTIGEKTYFRILQKSKLGKINYSNIVHLSASNTAWVAYPNPVKDELALQNQSTVIKPNNAKLYSADGKMIENILLNQSLQKIKISHLAKGIYILRLQNGEAIKIIKQ